MKQRFEEDRAELEAHFAERVQAYIELGETPEQAQLSAREKFGQTETVIRTLRWQRVTNSPLFWGVLCASSNLLFAALFKSLWGISFFSLTYAVYLWKTQRRKSGYTSS